MVVRELITKIAFVVDPSGAQRANAMTERVKTNMNGIGKSSTLASSAMSRSMNSAARAMTPLMTSIDNVGRRFTQSFAAMSTSAGRVTAGLGRIRGAITGITGALGPLAGAMAAAFSVKSIKDTADEMMNLDGRLRTVTKTEAERIDTEDKLYALSQNNRQSLSSMGDLYYKVARGAQQFGVSQEDSMRVTDTVSKALTVGGASVQEAQASILQLGQALSSGTLQGDELHSLDENASLLMQHMAENMGVTIGDLKKMGSQGLLTSDEVIRAILASGDAIDNEFGKMPMTIGQAETKIKNSWDMMILRIQRDTGVFSEIATSIDQTFSEVFQTVSDFMDLWNGPKEADPESVMHINALREAHPILEEIVEGLKNVLRVMDAIGQATGIDNIIMKFVLIAGAATVLGGLVGLIGSAVGALIGVFSGLWGVVSGVVGALLAGGWPILAVIAAIAAAIYFVKNHWDAVMAAFSPGLEKMEQGLAFLADAWERMQPVIEALIPPLSAVAEVIGGLIVDAIANFFNMAGYAFRAVGGLIDFIATLLQGLFNTGVWVFNGLTSLINTVASALQKVGEFIQWCADGLAGLINKAKDFLGMKGEISAEGSALQSFAQQVIPVGGNTSNTSYVFNVGSASDAIGVSSSLGISAWP